MSSNRAFVYIPDTFDANKVGYIEGLRRLHDRSPCYFITRDSLRQDSRNSIGYCGQSVPYMSESHLNPPERIYLNSRENHVTVGGPGGDPRCSVTSVYYDYATFSRDNAYNLTRESDDVCFDVLSRAVNPRRNSVGDGFVASFVLQLLIHTSAVCLKLLDRLDLILKYSAFFVHWKDTFSTLHWATTTIKRDKTATLRISNVLVSMIVDSVLGSLTVYYLFKHEEEIIKFVTDSAEAMIDTLKQVLNVLVDSPAGLKLNDALNKKLATFFFYHISLWRTFILAIHILLPTVFRVFLVSGACGISLQVAIVSDLISFLTFHVYCIYVYAARLYGIQIYGITSLWKLFIGRKYNPLRSRIDSFQYTYNQLFVGTLGFTVLLFLLPTIFLYYSVFTSFRVCLLLVNEILQNLRYVLKNLSVYILLLWILNSTKLKGSLAIEFLRRDNTRGFLYATLKTLSLRTTISATLSPKMLSGQTMSWKSVFKGILTGTLL